MTSASRWTPEMDDRLRAMWAAGVAVDEIGATLGFSSTQTIYARTGYLDLPSRRAASAPTTWTPEKIERLRALWAEGLSASKIGAEIGLSRNAVLGAAHRYKLPPRMLSTKMRIYEPKGPQSIRRAPKVRRPPRAKPAPAPRPVLKAEPIVEIVPTGRTPVRFLASGDFVCKVFLPGEPLGPDGLVCGNPVATGSPLRFCAACCAAMRIGPAARPPRVVRDDDRRHFNGPKRSVLAA